MYLWLFVICFAAARPSNAALFDWIWRGSQDSGNDQISTGNAPLITVPFEAQTDDEKFLEEASKFTEIMKSSALDQCQHKVVLKIKTSCSAMTEEELAKLSVNLLNCQSAVDGRQIFPCIESMSLKECTMKMDANMWNAYHMMNNRARAVCLAARRAQFQALSEMTVNKLMSTAHNQIKQMTTMMEGQERLESLTTDTLSAVEKGNIALLTQQERLRTTQQGIQDFVSNNLRELVREKALIAAGHKELSEMTGNIKDKLDEANQQLILQSLERSGNHQQLLKDIEAVQKQAQEIFERIDQSTAKLLAQHKAATLKYKETVENLIKINETVQYLLNIVNMTRHEIDERFSWIQHFLGGTEDQLGKVTTVVFHVIYLLLGMLFASFLNFSTIARAALAFIVPVNLFVTYYQGPQQAFDFPQMTTLLAILTLVNAFVQSLLSYVLPPKPQLYCLKDSNQRPVVADSGDGPVKEKKPVSKKSIIPFYSMFESVSQFSQSLVSRFNNFVHYVIYGSPTKDTQAYPSNNDETMVSSTLSEEREYGEQVWATSTPVSVRHRNNTPPHSLVSEWLHSKVNYVPPPRSTSSRASNSPKVTCLAVCRSGRRCRNVSTPGRDYCHRHLQGTSIAS